MTDRLARLLLFAAAMTVLLGSARNAEAGFLSVSVEDVLAESRHNLDPGMGSSPVESPDPFDLPAFPKPEFQRAIPSGTSQTGSGAGAGAGGVSPTVLVAILPLPSDVPHLVRTWLSSQEESFQPRFMKSRIFRPPRS
jgi:hypothetical protein